MSTTLNEMRLAGKVLTALSADDILLATDDPLGGPVSKIITWANAQLSITTLASPTANRITINPSSPTFDLAANVLGVDMITPFSSNVSVATGKIFNYFRLSKVGGGYNVHDVAGTGQVDGIMFQLQLSSASDALSQLHGVVGVVSNASSGSAKAVYGRAVAESGSGGPIVGGVFAAVPVATTSTAWILQLAGSSFVDAAAYIHADDNVSADFNDGIVYDMKVRMESGGAFFKAFGTAGHAGDFLSYKSQALAPLFVVDKDGNVATAGFQEFTEMSAPSTPAANKVRLYAKTGAVSNLYFKKDDGTEVDLSAGGGFADPMTTIGDIIIRNGSNATARLGIGTAGQVLSVTGGVPVWTTFAGGGDALVANPLSQFASTTSAQFFSVISNETGSGLVMGNDTPTILTPTIASFVNAGHDHSNAAGGGTISAANLTGTLADARLSANVPLLNAANVFTVSNELRRDGIAAAFTNAFKLSNTTAATAGVQVQQSPSVLWTAHVWNTDFAADNVITVRETLIPYYPSEAEFPRAKLVWDFDNGDTVQRAVELYSNGVVGAGRFTAGSVGEQFVSVSVGGLTVGNGLVSLETGNGNVGGTLAVDGASPSPNVLLSYYGDYLRIVKVGLGTVVEIEGAATDEIVHNVTGANLTTGVLLGGVVPASGFTGDLIKITDDAGSPVTKFRVTSAGVIITDGGLSLGTSFFSATAPTITAGFGTSPTIAGTSTSFTITVGSGGSASTGTITFPAAPAGWIVTLNDVTNNASFVTSQTGGSSTTATIQNYSRTTGLATPWAAGDVLRCTAVAY